MRRRLLISFLLFVFGAFFYPENFDKTGNIFDLNKLYYDIDFASDIKFLDGKILIRDYEKGKKADDYIVFQEKVELVYESKIPFLRFPNGNKYLILANSDLCILYDKSDNKPKCFGTNLGNGSELIDYIDKNLVVATSELKEGSTLFRASNIATLNINEPWVEGQKDYGIGEEIQFKGNCSYIYIFNGFVSYNKPYLYENNARIKKIEISFPEEENRNPIVWTLNDTPNPQKINLGKRCNSIIKIKILDIYEGTKYRDTCLNGIIFKVY